MKLVAFHFDWHTGYYLSQNEPVGTDYLAKMTGYDTTLSDHAYDLIFAFVLDMDSLKELVDRVIDHQHLSKKH